VKTQQAQRTVIRDTSRPGDTAYEAPVIREPQQEARAEVDVYADSLDIPLNQGGMMDAVRDAVRANL
jgi:hypothetical protein